MTINTYSSNVDVKNDYGIRDNIQNAYNSAISLLDSNDKLTKEIESLKYKINKLVIDNKDLKQYNTQLLLRIINEEKSNKDPIVLMSYEEAVDYSHEYGQLYLEKINWSNIDINKYEELISSSLKLGNSNHLFFILNQLLITRASNLTELESELILESFITLFDNNELNKIENKKILDLLELIYLSINENLLIVFTDTLKDYIYELFRDSSSQHINIKLIIARILYILEEFNLSMEFLFLFEDVPCNEYVLNDDLALDLILMQIYFTHYIDESEIENIDTSVLNKEYELSGIIQTYFKANKNIDLIEKLNIKIDEYINNLENLESEISIDLRSRSLYFMVEELRKLQDNKREMITNKVILPKVNSEEYVENELFIIKNKEKSCPFDYTPLIEKNILSKIYKTVQDRREGKDFKIEEIEALYCNECGKFFMNQLLNRKIKGYVNQTTLKKNPKSRNRNNAFDRNSMALGNKVIHIGSIFDGVDADINVIPMQEDIILNEKSPLRRMGYNTSVSDEKRWEILEKQCIAKLGVNTVIFYINSFIKRFSKQKKDYSRSIAIWQHDLDRIRKKYVL